ncbi:MAG TPA: type II toxin-antitoxin system HicB family antitoxin [Actinomycetes bacterium]|nr:type II toxin-antitoxin system HicB family antitoxin [Actinomycetes bacterium]
MTLTVEVNEENGALWGRVLELPGCFATGDTLDELMEALGESIALYQADTSASSVREANSKERPSRYRVNRLTLVDA